MAGIETITSEILQEARNKADSVISEAKKRVQDEEDSARAEGEKYLADTLKKAESQAALYAERIQSQIDMQRKQAVLGEKQNIITDVIKKAQSVMENLGGADYAAMILKLLQNCVHGEKGEILFSAKDKKNLTADLIKKIGEIAAKKGGSLTLSDETADIDSGFILRYGGIEENCSLKALFADRQEELQDLVHKLLF